MPKGTCLYFSTGHFNCYSGINLQTVAHLSVVALVGGSTLLAFFLPDHVLKHYRCFSVFIEYLIVSTPLLIGQRFKR